MKLTHRWMRIWGAIAYPPTPEEVRSRLLREAQLDRLKSLAHAESLAVDAMAYKEHAEMLRRRIDRLSREVHA